MVSKLFLWEKSPEWASTLLYIAASIILLVRVRSWVLRRQPCSTPVKTLVVLGSGGHTAEMIVILKSLPLDKYLPRTYVVAKTDKFSAEKAKRLEESLSNDRYKITSIQRSREVRQSYVTSVFTTLLALKDAALLVLRENPSLVLANGPGTCIPITFWASILTFVGLLRCKVVYVESIARVRHLSLTGKLLHSLGLADALLVQWEVLRDQHQGTEYAGRIM